MKYLLQKNRKTPLALALLKKKQLGRFVNIAEAVYDLRNGDAATIVIEIMNSSSWQYVAKIDEWSSKRGARLIVIVPSNNTMNTKKARQFSSVVMLPKVSINRLLQKVA